MLSRRGYSLVGGLMVEWVGLSCSGRGYGELGWCPDEQAGL